MTDVISNATDQKPVEVIGLWPCVHDGELLSLSSDLVERTVMLSLRLFYINSFHNLGENATFAFLLTAVSSARAMRHRQWPGEYPISSELPWEEQNRLRHKLYARGRMESIAWSEFENLVASDEGEIMNGSLTNLSAKEQSLMFEIYFRTPGREGYLYMTLEFEKLSVLSDEKGPMTIEEYLALGNAYWEAFASRK
jgi:hypothetical protein